MTVNKSSAFEEKTLWSKLINKTQNWSKSYSSKQLDNFQIISQSSNISENCNESIRRTLKGIESLNDWSLLMINSWGSFPPTGLLEGTSSDFGSYDQCLSIEPNGIIGEPQYCMVDLSPPIPQPMPIHHNLYHRIDVLPQEYYDRNTTQNSTNIFYTFSEFASFYYWISLRTGICMPSKCSSDDITQLAKGFAENYGLEFKKIQCQTKSNNSLNFIQITAMYYIFTDNFIIFYLTDIQFFFLSKIVYFGFYNDFIYGNFNGKI